MTKFKSGGRNRYENREINASAPERNEIIEMLEKHGKPLQRKGIVSALKVESDDSREILRRPGSQRTAHLQIVRPSRAMNPSSNQSTFAW